LPRQKYEQLLIRAQYFFIRPFIGVFPVF